MKYKTKLAFSFFLLTFLTTGLVILFFYFYASELVYKQIQSNALSVSATVASMVDGDLHEELQTRTDEKSDSYKILESQLQKVRDANRRDDVYIQYIYTLKKSKENPEVNIFVVDPEESFENKSHMGDIFKGEADIPLSIGEHQVDNHFSKDQWGVWLSANSPIKNKKGETVATLGVDIKATEVKKVLNKIVYIGIIALFFSIIIALISSCLISKWICKPLLLVKNTLKSIKEGNLDARIEIRSNDEFGEVGQTINEMAEGLKERNKIKKIFSRYVSKNVVEKILDSKDSQEIHGIRRRITVLFSDIRNFSSMAENMPPEKVVCCLNEYFEKMITVIFKNNGTLDKFMGDGLMVIFGAPLDDFHQEENAIKTALEMKKETDMLTEKWKSEGKEGIKIGIGINSGNAIVGNIGSLQRLEYTAIGNTVNLASRIESSTKELGADILISEYTYSSVRSFISAENKGGIYVKGRSDPINVYSVIGLK